MKKTIITGIITVVLGLILTVGMSELYSRNETFHRWYVGYANAVADQIYDTMQGVGIKTPKIVVVE